MLSSRGQPKVLNLLQAHEVSYRVGGGGINPGNKVLQVLTIPDDAKLGEGRKMRDGRSGRFV
jgi:hypothetical protein